MPNTSRGINSKVSPQKRQKFIKIKLHNQGASLGAVSNVIVLTKRSIPGVHLTPREGGGGGVRGKQTEPGKLGEASVST